MLTALLIVAVLVELVLIIALRLKLKDHEERLGWVQSAIRRLPPEIKDVPGDLSPVWRELQRQILASYQDRDPYALIEANRRQVQELERLAETAPRPNFREHEPDTE
jgi:hypothetical protein